MDATMLDHILDELLMDTRVMLPKKYFKVTNKDDFIVLLSLGFGYQTKDPWRVYESMMIAYGQDSCVDLHLTVKTIMYSPESYYLNKGYTRGNESDAKYAVEQNRNSNPRFSAK